MAHSTTNTSPKQALVVLVPLLFALFACKLSSGGDARVKVDCEGGETAITCDVNHAEGNDRAKACWDLSFQCANGTHVAGSSCQEVDPGETAQRVIPLGQLKNASQCDQVVASQVLNLKITTL